MIARERLEQLIEKGAEIWHLCGRKDIRKTNARDIPTHYRLNNFKDWELYKEYYFETKEDAKFSLEFQNITRTETLNLPTWEEFDERKFVWFFDKNHKQCCLYYMNCSNKIFINTNGNVIDTGEFTKENYLEACKIAKKVFLGEE